MTVKEQDFDIDVVHRCFMEGGDSILGAFFAEPLRMKLQDEQ